MKTLLGREPGEIEWKEIEISDQTDIEAYIGDWAEEIQIRRDIKLHISNEISNVNERSLINLVISFSGAAYPIFGNVLLSGTGDKGEPIPLNQEQLKFIEASSHSLAMPSGLHLMHLYPEGFQSTQMEPLRTLGNLLSDEFLLNNHSLSS